MKSYNHLYEKCISEENRRQAIKAAKRSKRIRRIIKERHLSDDALLYQSYDWIVNYQNADHTPIQIEDGITHKTRIIVVPTLEELIVQHCVVNALKPMFTRGMYRHTYASIPKRGAHKGKKVIQKWIRTDSKNTRYILKMDIHHFFDSVPHEVLKQKLAKYIHDELMLDLLFKIVDVTDIGIPLGFYTSQWFSNWLLQELDHSIKEDFGATYYIRYMDDMIIFGRNKKKLHRIRAAIGEFLDRYLGLELKENWQVFLFDIREGNRDLDFMGFRFFRNKIILRKSIMLKATRKARKIHRKERPTIYDCRQMMSYLGWLKSTDTYNMYLSLIKPYINFGKLKRYISSYDKTNDYRINNMFANFYQGKEGQEWNLIMYMQKVQLSHRPLKLACLACI